MKVCRKSAWVVFMNEVRKICCHKMMEGDGEAGKTAQSIGIFIFYQWLTVRESGLVRKVRSDVQGIIRVEKKIAVLSSWFLVPRNFKINTFLHFVIAMKKI